MLGGNRGVNIAHMCHLPWGMWGYAYYVSRLWRLWPLGQAKLSAVLFCNVVHSHSRFVTLTCLAAYQQLLPDKCIDSLSMRLQLARQLALLLVCWSSVYSRCPSVAETLDLHLPQDNGWSRRKENKGNGDSAKAQVVSFLLSNSAEMQLSSELCRDRVLHSAFLHPSSLFCVSLIFYYLFNGWLKTITHRCDTFACKSFTLAS